MDRRNRIEQLCQGNTGRSCGTRNMVGSGWDPLDSGPFGEYIANGVNNLLGNGNTSGKKIYMDPDGTEDITKEENKEIEDSKEDTDYTDLIKKQREEKEDELHDEMLNTILEDESNITAFVTSYYEAGHITKGDADILLVKLTNKANKNKKKYESIITRLKGRGLRDFFRRKLGRTTGSEPLIDENEEVLQIASRLFSHYLKNRNNRRLDEWLNGSRKRPKTTKSKKFKKKVVTEYFKMKNNHVDVEYEREDGSKVDMR